MDEVRLGDASVHVLAVVRGLPSEAPAVAKAIEFLRPDVVAVSIAPEEVDALRAYTGGPADPENFEEEIYVAGLSAWEEPVKPPPCFTEAVRRSDAAGVRVEGIDMDESTYTDAYTEHVSAMELILQGRAERRLARNAALAALSDLARVQGRGHRFKEGLSLPVVVEDEIEAFAPEDGAAKAGLEVLAKLGLMADVERAKAGRHVRAGRGKMRGRRYRTPCSLLVVVKEPSKVRRTFGNLPGVEVVGPAGLNAEILAPGGHAGRLTVFSEGALEVLRSWHA